MSNKLHLILVSSLVLNGLLGGYAVGTATHSFRGHPPMGDMQRPPMFEREAERLPGALRDKMGAAMKAEFDKSKEIREKIDQTRKEIGEILSAQTFDEKAYDEKSNQLFGLINQIGNNMADTIKGVARDASVEDRKALAEMLKHGPFGAEPNKHGRPPFDKDGRPGPDDRHGDGPRDMGPDAAHHPDDRDDAPRDEPKDQDKTK